MTVILLNIIKLKKLSAKYFLLNLESVDIDIARRFNFFYKYHLPNFNYLSKKLYFDEFKSVKKFSGTMSFIFCNVEFQKIIDMLEDRRLNQLKNYFSKYSQKTRNSVTDIVIDMYYFNRRIVPQN